MTHKHSLGLRFKVTAHTSTGLQTATAEITGLLCNGADELYIVRLNQEVMMTQQMISGFLNAEKARG